MKRDGTGCALTFIGLLVVYLLIAHFSGCVDRPPPVNAEDRGRENW